MPILPRVEPKRQRPFTWRFLSTLFLVFAAFFVGSAFVVTDYKERVLSRRLVDAVQISGVKADVMENTRPRMCESQCSCRPQGSETLPKGIVSKTSDLEMRPLSGPVNKKKSKSVMNLLAIAAGIKQKESVNKIVKKFLAGDFVIMLFHYDGVVDDWRDLDWNNRAIHVSAINQTKWWFAKRFLHPDIVSEYAYIFLWDEDLGVENFDVGRYVSIIKEEGLEISQPALDPNRSWVHHQLTERESGSKVHRRTYKLIGSRKCDKNSTDPPCTGWVEMMAPVFSRASWRCAWHMIQGDRTKVVGIVDSEYILHYGVPTLGGLVPNKVRCSVLANLGITPSLILASRILSGNLT
ncbi:hypothetical protein CJ030_MR1G002310 [Morella rubra]|uniref:Uncharacterized protein n=1 Tax=Morella rubra TaxID=262757 RepID=A0A6A1WS83_9ROSI|nr:hypothetical protein CJ030_MR1G002310 [Morella rubra]